MAQRFYGMHRLVISQALLVAFLHAWESMLLLKLFFRENEIERRHFHVAAKVVPKLVITSFSA